MNDTPDSSDNQPQAQPDTQPQTPSDTTPEASSSTTTSEAPSYTTPEPRTSVTMPFAFGSTETAPIGQSVPWSTPTTRRDAPAWSQTPTPARPSGPHAPAILLGLVCLVVAGLALGQEVGGLKIDWGNVGPLGITVAGGVLVALGLLGLLTSRRRARG
ncbi:hypothetical protein [Pedococcus sp. 5OH_020]|uniref:hypothetical protein n=1 Tax=Pedococcus sp. 5OH_020 TaxID=2989814 RepID=UPI0022E9CC30|nr:hypothetical protein [Pedococcus sp. 5OH_020]